MTSREEIIGRRPKKIQPCITYCYHPFPVAAREERKRETGAETKWRYEGTRADTKSAYYFLLCAQARHLCCSSCFSLIPPCRPTGGRRMRRREPCELCIYPAKADRRPPAQSTSDASGRSLGKGRAILPATNPSDGRVI